MEPIAHSGELGGIGCRGRILGRRMQPVLGVISDPAGGGGRGVVEAEEQGLVEEFVPHSAVERLADAVLLRLAGRD